MWSICNMQLILHENDCLRMKKHLQWQGMHYFPRNPFNFEPFSMLKEVSYAESKTTSFLLALLALPSALVLYFQGDRDYAQQFFYVTAPLKPEASSRLLFSTHQSPPVAPCIPHWCCSHSPPYCTSFTSRHRLFHQWHFSLHSFKCKVEVLNKNAISCQAGNSTVWSIFR